MAVAISLVLVVTISSHRYRMLSPVHRQTRIPHVREREWLGRSPGRLQDHGRIVLKRDDPRPDATDARQFRGHVTPHEAGPVPRPFDGALETGTRHFEDVPRPERAAGVEPALKSPAHRGTISHGHAPGLVSSAR